MASELILVVEDNDKNRKLVRDVLTHKGYEVIETEDARSEGLETLGRKRGRRGGRGRSRLARGASGSRPGSSGAGLGSTSKRGGCSSTAEQ